MTAIFILLLILSSYLISDVLLSLLGLPSFARRLIILALALAISVFYLTYKKQTPKKALIQELCELWEIKKSPLPDCAACLFLGLGLNTFCTSVISLLPSELTASYASASAHLASLTPGVFLDTVIAAPVFEELLFRRAVLGTLTTLLPHSAALALSAVIFGSFHGSPIWMIYSAFCAIALGAVYLKYRSVIPSIVLHLAFNGANYVFALLPITLSPYLLICASLPVCILSAAFMFAKKEK